MDESSERSRERIQGGQWLLFPGLLLLLVSPWICAVLGLPEGVGLEEKRHLSPPPSWTSAEGWSAWPRQAEAWLNDHYPQRARMIRWHGLIRQRGLGAPTANVIIGRDDWLFYAGDRTAEDLLGQDRFSPAQLDQWMTALESREARLRAAGIAYLLVIAPNKSSIYPEQLPSALWLARRSGKLDQLLAAIRARGRVEVLDLRPALLEAKRVELVYWRHDSHWNARGLQTANEAVIAHLTKLGFAVGAGDAGQWQRVVGNAERPQDCIEMLGLKGVWPGEAAPEVVMTFPADLKRVDTPLLAQAPWKDQPAWQRIVATERESGRGRIVMYCDSFFRAGGIPLSALGDLPLSLYLRRHVSLWGASEEADLEAVIALERPDVVIEEFVERRLAQPPPAPVSGAAQASVRE